MAHFARYSLVLFALFLGASSAYSMPAGECFDDKKLVSLQLQSKRGSMVYVWSPRMVYSVQQMTIAARAAAVNGLDFVAVHDARVPEKELITFKSKSNPPLLSAEINIEAQDLATPPYFPPTDSSLPLCASELLKSEALRHFPTAFIVTAQGVHRHPIVGAMPTAAWHSSIAQRLQQP
jgi:hypothetical protein